MKITGASVTVGRDLTVNYSVKITEEGLLANLADISMRFTMNGKTAVVALDPARTDADGDYVFPLTGIAPQQMTDTIQAELLLGETVITSKDAYSVKENAEKLLEVYAEDAALVQLVTDLLTYGAAAQTYMGYNAEALANAGVAGIGTPSAALPTEEDNALTVTTHTETLGDVYFATATVWFDTVNRIGVRLGTYTENTKLVVKIGDGEATAYEALTSAMFYTDAIYAVSFGDVYTFELYEGEELLQTLTYSVNSYVYAKADDVDGEGEPTEMALLAQALYRYGESAVAYKAAQGSEGE